MITVSKNRLREESTATFRTGTPFQKKQSFSVSASFSATGLSNPKRETIVVHETTFLEALQKGQAKWPGATISLRRIG